MGARRDLESPEVRRRKAEWATAQARSLRDQAFALERQSSGGQAIRACKKYENVAHLHQEAARFERIAAHYRDPDEGEPRF